MFLGKPNILDGRKWAPKIVGGEVSPLGAFPHQVSFGYDMKHFCGGSILNSESIATAAHCCEGLDDHLKGLTVLAGANNVVSPESGFQSTKVKKLIIHPSYNDSTLFNDICIVRLAEPLILSMEKRTSAVKLPQEGYTATGLAIASGWGATSEDGELFFSLMNVTVPIITDEEW